MLLEKLFFIPYHYSQGTSFTVYILMGEYSFVCTLMKCDVRKLHLCMPVLSRAAGLGQLESRHSMIDVFV